MRRKSNVTQLMLIAQDCITKNQFMNAIKILNQVIQLQPKNDQAYRLRADAYDQLGQIEEAEYNYKMGIDVNPLSTICYTNYGLLLFKAGKTDEAEKLYELCMQLNPEDPIVLNNYSILLYEHKKYEKAEEISKKCLKIDPNNTKCKEYLKRLDQRKQRKVSRLNAEAKNKQDQLLNLLWQRDIKIVEKETLIQTMKQQLAQKNELIKKLKNQLDLMKKKMNQEEAMKLCKICLHNNALFINKNCGHLSSCKNCIDILGGKCPICREEAIFMKVFSSAIKE